MSAAVTSATCTPMIPHGNLTDICHSVKVRSDPKAKYNSQRFYVVKIGYMFSVPAHSQA